MNIESQLCLCEGIRNSRVRAACWKSSVSLEQTLEEARTLVFDIMPREPLLCVLHGVDVASPTSPSARGSAEFNILLDIWFRWLSGVRSCEEHMTQYLISQSSWSGQGNIQKKSMRPSKLSMVRQKHRVEAFYLFLKGRERLQEVVYLS